MPAGYELLTVARINSMMQALQDVRELPQELSFLRRTSVVPAIDGEIMGRFIGRVIIADIISDDAKAVTYSAQKVQLERTSPPNLKVGQNMTQSMINQLNAINGAGGIPDPQGLFSDYLNRTMDGLLLGVRQRMEALIIAMHLDNFNYDKLGVKITNATWGMPADLNVTPSIPWDNVNATPVTDVWTTNLVARVRYGVTYNRLTMSTTAFRYMIATTEFLNKAKLVVAPTLLGATLQQLDIGTMKNVALAVLGIDSIELYDARYWQQDTAGNTSSSAFLPITEVILDSSSNDNNSAVQDFANGVVTETIVNSIMGGNIVGRFTGGAYGPVGYATSPVDLNPPQVSFWGVARGFPRKYMLQANAVLHTGSYVDSIATGVPF